MTRRLQALACAALFAALTSTPSVAARQTNIAFKDDPNARHMPVYKPQYAPCCNPGPGIHKKRQKIKIAKHARRAIRVVKQKPRVQIARRNIFTEYAALPKGNKSLAGVTPVLANKTRQIVAACGSRVISAVRHTRVKGSGRMSLHSQGRAVDLQGNPGCIRRQLAGWRGGLSTDYHRVNHYHVSWGGREHGIRFAHYGGRKSRRYASAG